MSRHQVLTITAFMLIFAVLYFGFDKKSREQKELEKSRSQNLELINIESEIREARQQLPADLRMELEQLEEQTENSGTDEEKASYLKSTASMWYQTGNALLSAHYAEKVADIENTAEAWSIAGTSYAIAAQRAGEDRKRVYASQKSRVSLENALSIDPDNVDNKINLALSYVEVPSEDNPMKGIMMLLDLNKEYPENTAVLMQLARLAIQTNQLERARERLTKVLEINPELNQAHCMLYDVYTKLGEQDKAEQERQLCE